MSFHPIYSHYNKFFNYEQRFNDQNETTTAKEDLEVIQLSRRTEGGKLTRKANKYIDAFSFC